MPIAYRLFRPSRLIAGRRRTTLCVAIVAAMLVHEPALARTVTPRGELTPDERVTIDVFERSKRSVVYISTSERVRDPWTRNVRSIPRGTGSGFVWDDRGNVVTNFHVIEGASAARVRLNDGAITRRSWSEPTHRTISRCFTSTCRRIARRRCRSAAATTCASGSACSRSAILSASTGR